MITVITDRQEISRNSATFFHWCNLGHDCLYYTVTDGNVCIIIYFPSSDGALLEGGGQVCPSVSVAVAVLFWHVLGGIKYECPVQYTRHAPHFEAERQVLWGLVARSPYLFFLEKKHFFLSF